MTDLECRPTSRALAAPRQREGGRHVQNGVEAVDIVSRMSDEHVVGGVAYVGAVISEPA